METSESEDPQQASRPPRGKILEEINAIEDDLSIEVDQEMIKKFHQELKLKLKKLEESRVRKAPKLQYDKLNYEQEQIFIFAKKCDYLHKQLMRRTDWGRKVLEEGSIPSSEVDTDMDEGQ
ncbi:hypothetical protein NDU88_009203 [Pleurodeles waltl]|uniref:Uncharacterized protein n=1 Tax=Pleurodeles waltl TaxID=8319 RepID=A0AAV7RZ25_PLEWA|nr:hypothetical protein NDU88_009203 [Pleurodeles waltl]